MPMNSEDKTFLIALAIILSPLIILAIGAVVMRI